MKILFLTLGVLGLLALALGAPVEAQMQPPPATGSPASKMGGGTGNNSSMLVMNGTVTAVNRSAPQTPDQQVQVRLTLQTPRGPLPVLLGPAAFVDQQPVQIAVGDVVEVTGSLVSRGRKTRIIAAQVRKGNQVLQLRNEQGQPLGPSAPRR